MGVRALGAFSGGLDSMLAALLLRDQGIEVELVTFHSPFFSSRSGREGAERLGMPLRTVDMTGVIMELLEEPPSGFGSNMNPCIDCHAAMVRIIGDMAAAEGADLVFTGEVLGQRPMSQNRGSLNRVANLSGYGDILLRPLSARLLEPTRPEMEGLVDRERLLDLSGRGRKRQMRLAEAYGIDYETPGGGCVLTDPGFSRRLRALMEAGLFTERAARLARHGRMFRLGPSSVGLVGRSRGDNRALERASGSEGIALSDRPGPTGILLGDPSGLPLLASLVARYGKVPPGETAEVLVEGGPAVLTGPADDETASSLSV